MTRLRPRMLEDMQIRNLAPATQRAYVEYSPNSPGILVARRRTSGRRRFGPFRCIASPSDTWRPVR